MSRILIIHHHLNPGGVTRIIESQVEALQSTNAAHKLVVVTGHCENREFFASRGIKLVINKYLNYLDPDGDHNEIYKRLKSFFNELLEKDDILHVHNLNLGKNPLVTLLISEFISEGYAVVNHAHDFAEDRPVNYQFLKSVIGTFHTGDLHSVLYPNTGKLAYAVLNSADLERIQSYLGTTNRLYLLPNPVVANTEDTQVNTNQIRMKICRQLEIDPAKKIVTYPVRVIRRKNIGEYILLCMLLKHKAHWLVTLPPKNPVEVAPYMKWKQFCDDEQIPVYFEAGTKVEFTELIQSSDLCFTTSIQEGFGMVYMEPWLLGTPVAGRNLKYITRDLEQSGMKFPLLYTDIITSEGADFGVLPMEQQMNIIRSLNNNHNKQKEFIEQHTFINNLLNSIDQKVITNNQHTISQEYSLEKYAQRLERIYQAITG